MTSQTLKAGEMQWWERVPIFDLAIVLLERN
jgi:hypothetical protein